MNPALKRSEDGNDNRAENKKILDNQGMAQKELAEKAGVTELEISRYVHDERIPQTLILIDICDTLHVSSDYLLGIRYCGLKEKENEVTE